jgi:quercetin dioxygenase-like cupin family protein
MRQSIIAAKPPHTRPTKGYASPTEQGDFPVHYEHLDQRLGIHFQVIKLPFEQLQAMDARLLTIAPGATNEKHRHAHESIFVVLKGEALMDIGGEELCLAEGDVAYAPRWAVHQTRNRSQETELRMLAITDFGLTSALIGNYDRSTRLKSGGEQAFS